MSLFKKNWLPLLALFVFGIGIFWRYHHIFTVHPATDYIYSDMQTYVQSAINAGNPEYHQTIADTIYPPGFSFFLSYLFTLDPSWQLAISAQFIISLLIPLLIAMIGWELFGLKTSCISLILASLYFPFIDYAAYFLSENILLFSISLSFLILIWALKAQRVVVGLGLGLLSGLVLGLATAIKSIVLLPSLLVTLAILSNGIRFGWKPFHLVSLTGFLGLVILLIPLAMRCTQLNEGHYCTVNNNGGMGVLLGHYGPVEEAQFKDEKRGMVYNFGSPEAIQMGYQEKPVFPFGAYDSKRAIKLAIKWTKENPLDALLLSTHHVFALFAGTIPWPSSNTPLKKWLILSQELFWIFILVPAIIYVITNKKRFLDLKGTGMADLVLILPLIGLMIVVFFTFSEPRYRIPWDGFTILLAARFYSKGELDPKRENFLNI